MNQYTVGLGDKTITTANVVDMLFDRLHSVGAHGSDAYRDPSFGFFKFCEFCCSNTQTQLYKSTTCEEQRVLLFFLHSEL